VCKTPLAFCREIIQLKQASILRDLLILSLASKEPIHVLLICDETIQSRVLADTLAQAFEGQAYDAPLTQLGPVAIGEHIERGLLAQNAQKLLVIDKFEKQTDKDALYKSMEYGVLTVQTDTGTKSMQADPKILALAHPIKDIFNARTLPQLKEQITLKDQDLAKFHCISIVRQPTLTKLHNSTIQPKTLTADDTKLLCEYISYVQEVETTLPKDYHDKIVNFITTLKEREKQFIAPISSRLVQGLVRLTLASAKLHLRDTVNAQDLKTSMDIVQAILEAV
jgi:replicative DNA helicase Mcm